jgi:tetratricopeptide (TPR) repeat protein
MPSQPLTPGARVGRYEVIAHLATGGMGQVYKARDVELERVVALKVLPGHVAGNPMMVERFRREARNAARLTHKNVVTLYDWGQDGGTYYLALEFVDGFDLSGYIATHGRLDAEEAWRITVQAARALDHAFGQGITHRDIKPSNFLLARRGRKLRLKLTDFGLARATHEDDFRVTRDGTTVGTIDYMAPEQARDSASADCRSDIYSLGCTLYHMLAGQAPFAEGGLGERVYRHQSVEPRDVREHNPDVPEGLWLVLRRMLAKRPEDRYATPHDLVDALLRLGAPTATTRNDLAPAAPVGNPPPALRSPPTPAAQPTADTLAVSAEEVLGVTAEDRQAAAKQFEVARPLLADEGGDPAEAFRLLLACCRLDPANVAYRRALRRAVRLTRHRGEAPPTAGDARDRFAAARLIDDERKVLEVGEEVLAGSPEDLETHVSMAEAAAGLNLVALQAWLLRQACKEQPANVELRRRLARAYERRRDVGKAIAAWREIRKASPGDAEAAARIEALLRVLARAYERQNDRDSAVAVWEAVLKLRPQDEEAQQRICGLLLDSETAPAEPV